MDRQHYFGLVVALSGLLACNDGARGTARSLAIDSVGVGQARETMVRALLAGDSTAFAGYYTDSAVFVAAGMPNVVGRSAIQSVVGQIMASTQYRHYELHPMRVSGQGGSLNEVGWQYDVTAEHGKPPQQSWQRYGITWRRAADGKWQVDLDFLVADSSHALPDSTARKGSPGSR